MDTNRVWVTPDRQILDKHLRRIPSGNNIAVLNVSDGVAVVEDEASGLCWLAPADGDMR